MLPIRAYSLNWDMKIFTGHLIRKFSVLVKSSLQRTTVTRLIQPKINLSFPQIEVPWVIVLPNDKQLEASALCYQAALQQNRNSNRFNLIEANVITCQ